MKTTPFLPVSIAVSILSLFPAPHSRLEPVVAYSPPKPVKSLKIAPMPSYQALTYQPFPVAAYGTYSNTYTPANCTSYVASRKNIPNSWGNANTWADRARAEGHTVSNVPIVGAIAQSSRGSAGHVAVVVGIRPGQVLIDEQNYDYHGSIREDWQDVSRYTYIWI